MEVQVMDTERSESGPFPQRVFHASQVNHTVPKLSLGAIHKPKPSKQSIPAKFGGQIGASGYKNINGHGACKITIAPSEGRQSIHGTSTKSSTTNKASSVKSSIVSQNETLGKRLSVSNALCGDKVRCTDQCVPAAAVIRRRASEKALSTHLRGTVDHMIRGESPMTDASRRIESLLRALESRPLEKVSLTNELRCLQAELDTAVSGIRNVVKTIDLSQKEVAQMEDLAIEQWQRLTKMESEMASLKAEVKYLEKEKESLEQYRQAATALAGSNDSSSQDVSQYLTRIEQAINEKNAAERTAEQALLDLRQTEELLVEAKMNLADEKTKVELSNKLVLYYVKHLETCDPSYIVPLGDRARVEELQIADVEQPNIIVQPTSAPTPSTTTGSTSTSYNFSSPFKLIKTWVSSSSRNTHPVSAPGHLAPPESSSRGPKQTVGGLRISGFEFDEGFTSPPTKRKR